MAASRSTTSTVACRLTATNAASGGPGRSSTLDTQGTPARSERVGCTAHRSPVKPRRRHCSMAVSAGRPPIRANDRGANSRASRPVKGLSDRSAGSTPFPSTRTVVNPGSGTERPQHLAAHDVTLDLACAIPDAVHPCITPDPFQWQLVHEAHAPQDLDGLVGHELEHFGR